MPPLNQEKFLELIGNSQAFKDYFAVFAVGPGDIFNAFSRAPKDNDITANLEGSKTIFLDAILGNPDLLDYYLEYDISYSKALDFCSDVNQKIQLIKRASEKNIIRQLIKSHSSFTDFFEKHVDPISDNEAKTQLINLVIEPIISDNDWFLKLFDCKAAKLCEFIETYQAFKDKIVSILLDNSHIFTRIFLQTSMVTGNIRREFAANNLKRFGTTFGGKTQEAFSEFADFLTHPSTKDDSIIYGCLESNLLKMSKKLNSSNESVVNTASFYKESDNTHDNRDIEESKAHAEQLGASAK